MRPATALELKVGLLIVAGLVATVVMVLVSDRLHFEHYYRIKAYLLDAGGLRRQSPVTLSGIRIGEVESLATVDDPRGNIEVILKVNDQYRLPAGAKLTISSSGIFGDSYLAFAVGRDQNGPLLPTDGSAAVVAAPGFFDSAGQQAQKILAGASDLLGPETRDDIRRLIRSAADLAEAGGKLAQHVDAQNQRLAETLASVKALSDELRQTAKDLSAKGDAALVRLDHTLATVDERADQLGAKAADSLGKLDATLARGDQVLAANGEELGKTLASLRQLSERCARIADSLAGGDGVIGQLLMNRDLAKDLNNTAVDLSRTAAYLADHPEALVFGASKEDAAAEHAKREREKVRRAFNENYGGIPLQTQPAPAPR
jgi:phospholipid/cholesterol/gamma-HCH transport system substrate-binding protein